MQTSTSNIGFIVGIIAIIIFCLLLSSLFGGIRYTITKPTPIQKPPTVIITVLPNNPPVIKPVVTEIQENRLIEKPFVEQEMKRIMVSVEGEH
ncbi:MAG: hypothetical protein Barrevirus10_5 [Barrevirus sp.]|uniref:Uncharacterized protein n=1 Tax=Barrevirus sp. TaxID=2487763 RepID=A0A3G4ZUF8_9VIRU|nr:MAG: hypothetical protein Barrevirus10_5 [Barrevirus sp.]